MHACLSARVSCLAVLACVCCLPHHWAFALLAGLWAVAVALSRAVMGRHYLGDVLAGLLLGIVSAGVVTRVGHLNLRTDAIHVFKMWHCGICVAGQLHSDICTSLKGAEVGSRADFVTAEFEAVHSDTAGP